MLAGSYFVVLGLGGDAQLPQLFVQLLHESGDLGADDAEVVLLQLLTLGGRCAEAYATPALLPYNEPVIRPIPPGRT